ncbi:uncharacterized protein C5orf34 homolog isoform X1 [Chelonoidis abingdonii]|uniref:uncharacterized protein C5orf34 homolog isoform X1 n=1 Tax=Chelonoidis abingdonii TaxID=106734 RepID=UPI0013F1E292|nr:uncharacterized protein C5orf34 homolog isoform X1 [Chelonoidis abingdonii]XP_032636715.1 uncharacterized protein C5orf34 homolog isoform X1 [Chelonoidis abingdonii]
MKPESLMILYEDDSVEVHYIDGSRLLLSPCGSEFLFEKALSVSAHPLHPAERIRQRTQFVISTYREQLLRAIGFRNQFCTSLYLPSSIIPFERKNSLLSDISEINWPSPNATDAAEYMDNGSVKISSLDGRAYLCMSELQQEFSVEFLCKVSQKCTASSSFSEKTSNNQNKGQHGKSSRSVISEMFPKQMRMENKKEEHCWTINKCRELDKSKDCLNQLKRQDEAPLSLTRCSSEYVWVMQRWSVSSYPEEWKYPLSLALVFYQSHTDNICKTYVENKCTRNGTAGSDVLKETEKTKAVSHLPRALPLSCSAPHLHRWSFCDLFLQRKQDSEHNSHPLLIKIVWCQGIIYRFIHEIENFIEIYPGDGSVFKSEGPFLGNYFTHYSVHKETRQKEKKMYSANSLPPDTPASPYSICSIITQATRILQYCHKTKLSLTHNYSICCWRMVPGTDGREMLPVPLHETVIPNVGKLVAYSDNKVHALFCDGMTLNMVWDFSSCYGRTQNNDALSSFSSKINQGGTTGWCKVISPDGAQQLIQIKDPGIYERYIRIIVAWCRSLNDDEGETLPATERNWSVVAELEKIQRFNFLLQNSNVPNKTSAMKNNPSHITDGQPENSLPEDIGERSISEALEKTSKVIQDIESLLASSRK